MKKNLLIIFALLMSMSYSAMAQSAGDVDSLTANHPEYQSTLPIGSVVPEIAAPDTLGNTVRLSSYRGKYVVLDFWATWCGDCRREIPRLKEVYEKYKDMKVDGKSVEWLSLSFDTSAESWKNIIRKERFPWTQISNLKSTREDSTFKDYQLHWIPAFLIIDPEGKLVSTAITADALENNLFMLKKPDVYNLWPDGAPTSNGITAPEEDHTQFVVNVTKPVLTVYMPENPNGLAVLACPGGSYLQVWQGTEGHNMAKWYTDQGIVYAVLKYRLPNGHKEVPLNDVHEAMRIMKSNQSKYGFTKLGIQGCSAGGHLASTAATHFTNTDNRPDFQILFYPVISFDPSFTHMLSREDLIGKNAKQDIVDLYSNEKQVTRDTPPAFIASSSDDGLVPVRNSIEYYNALVANKVPVSMHLYPTGGHGWFGNTSFIHRPQWTNELKAWLQQQIEK
ncbi:MAG: redoxin domain-containing protein [Bacteroidaceae bacterium]|nr:redoxin domain-containing protein [Bacteroidaceae bacterium]